MLDYEKEHNMQSFSSLYKRLLKAGVCNETAAEIKCIESELDYDKHHLEIGRAHV